MTDVSWAALVEREAGKWRVLTHYHLARTARPALVKFLNNAEVDSWLCGALSGGQSRSVLLPDSSKLETARLFAFPLLGVSRVVVAGAEQLTSDSQRLWRLVVGSMQTDASTADMGASSVAASLLVPDLDSENPYDLPRALDRASDFFYPPRFCTRSLAGCATR